MRNKTRLLILTIMSLIMTVIIYFMSYKFNPRFYSTSKPLYVHTYRESGGHIFVLLILGLLITFTIIYFRFIMKDTNQLEIFDQVSGPEYYKKNNLLSFFRIIQYYTLFTAYGVFMRDMYRGMTYDGSLLALYIFRTDILFLMWDVVFVLFIVLNITLIIEYIKYKKTITE